MNAWIFLSVLGAIATAAWTLTFSAIPKTEESQAILQSLKNESEPLSLPALGQKQTDRDIAAVKSAGTLATSFTKVLEHQQYLKLQEKLNNINLQISSNSLLAKLQNTFGQDEVGKSAFALIYLNALQPQDLKDGDSISLSKDLFEELQKNAQQSVHVMERVLDSLVGQYDELENEDQVNMHASTFLKLDYYAHILNNSLKQESSDRYERLSRLADKSILSADDAVEVSEKKTKNILMIHSYIASSTPNAEVVIQQSIHLVQKNPSLKDSIEKNLVLMFPEAVDDFRSEKTRLGL